MTLQSLKNFRSTLQSANKSTDDTETLKVNDDKDKLENSDDESWKSHSFQCQDKNPVLAKDASTKDDDWFEIYDPRNPLNKRRRGENTEKKNKESRGNFSHSRNK